MPNPHEGIKRFAFVLKGKKTRFGRCGHRRRSQCRWRSPNHRRRRIWLATTAAVVPSSDATDANDVGWYFPINSLEASIYINTTESIILFAGIINAIHCSFFSINALTRAAHCRINRVIVPLIQLEESSLIDCFDLRSLHLNYDDSNFGL